MVEWIGVIRKSPYHPLAGLIWFRTIRKQLMGEQSFNQSDADPSYFWKRT